MTEHRIPQFQWNSLSYLTARAGRIGTQELTELMESESLTRHHFTIICALDEFGGISQNDLAARSNLNPGHMVAYLDQLATRGILERNVDPKDRRRNIITLTAEGKTFASRAMEATKHNEAKVFSALDEKQKEQLRTLLQLVAAQDAEARQ